MKNKFICPVCGYDRLKEAPYNEYGDPSYEICSCCGFEFGFDDSSQKITFKEYRKNWIDNGFRYFDKKKQPDKWNIDVLKKQLKNIESVNYMPRI